MERESARDEVPDSEGDEEELMTSSSPLSSTDSADKLLSAPSQSLQATTEPHQDVAEAIQAVASHLRNNKPKHFESLVETPPDALNDVGGSGRSGINDGSNSSAAQGEIKQKVATKSADSQSINDRDELTMKGEQHIRSNQFENLTTAPDGLGTHESTPAVVRPKEEERLSERLPERDEIHTPSQAQAMERTGEDASVLAHAHSSTEQKHCTILDEQPSPVKIPAAAPPRGDSSGPTLQKIQPQMHSTSPSAPVHQKPVTPGKPSQAAQLAELKAEKTALISSLMELPNIASLLDGQGHLEADPSDDDVMKAAKTLVNKHIKLLHQYNEIKDVGQGLMGLIAEQRGVRVVEIQEEFGVGVKD